MNGLFFLALVFSSLLLIGGIILICQAKKKGAKYCAIVMLTFAFVVVLTSCAANRKSTSISYSEEPISITKPKCDINSAYGHSYYNGICSNCGAKDPDYFDPENYGFINNYGMTMWIDISGYDFGNAEAYYKESKYSSDHNHLYRDFKNGVMYGYEHKKGTSEQDLGATYPYQILNNDTLTVSGTTITIFERVSDKNGNLVIKAMVTYTHYGSTESDEYWFILADQVDWEKSPVVSGEKESFYFQ